MAAKKATKKTTRKTVKEETKKPQRKTIRKPAKKTLKKTTQKTAKKPSTRAKKPSKTGKTAGRPSRVQSKKTTQIKKSEDERKVTLRKYLIQKREQIVKEAKAEISKNIKGEKRQLVDTALDDGDWSVVDLSEDISLRQLAAHKETLNKIDAALRKLDEGTYGKCEECGGEISAKRLEVMPYAIYCIDCQEKREQLEAVEREEGIG